MCLSKPEQHQQQLLLLLLLLLQQLGNPLTLSSSQ
jgi:hypothetical protein